MQAPRTTHLKATHRLLKYFKLSPGQGLFLPSHNSLLLTTYCDSDWGSCKVTGRSVSGFCVLLGSALISWHCKKQSVVSRSSAEAEYRSLATASCEIVWLLNLFQTLQVQSALPISVYCTDSSSTITLASNPVHHARTKHIELDCHFIREKVQQGLIFPIFVPSKLQLANIFTKSLGNTLNWFSWASWGF